MFYCNESFSFKRQTKISKTHRSEGDDSLMEFISIKSLLIGVNCVFVFRHALRSDGTFFWWRRRGWSWCRGWWRCCKRGHLQRCAFRTRRFHFLPDLLDDFLAKTTFVDLRECFYWKSVYSKPFALLTFIMAYFLMNLSSLLPNAVTAPISTTNTITPLVNILSANKTTPHPLI